MKLTIQIVDPSIKLIEKDVSATFNDKLGVVGTYILKQNPFSYKFVLEWLYKCIESRILTVTLNRRNNWSLHWTQLDQLCGVNILDDKGI